MIKFKVGITRIAYTYKEFEVLAETEEAAKELAMQKAYNHIWSGGCANYETECCEEVKG